MGRIYRQGVELWENKKYFEKDSNILILSSYKYSEII